MLGTKKGDLKDGENKGTAFFNALKGFGKPKTPKPEKNEENKSILGQKKTEHTENDENSEEEIIKEEKDIKIQEKKDEEDKNGEKEGTKTPKKNLFSILAGKKTDLKEGETKGMMFFDALKGIGKGKSKTPIKVKN